VFFDAHNHLHDAWLAPHRAGVLAELEALPLGAAVVNGTAEDDWAEVTALAAADAAGRGRARLWPSFGLHPWQVGNASPAWRERLRETLTKTARPLVGEVGLDRWILERARPDDPRLAGLRRAPLDEQVAALRWQLALAAEHGWPVTLHCLEAWGPLLDVLRDGPRLPRGFLLHAYGGSAELAREFASLGAYFSFNGAFLEPRQAAKRAVFAGFPPERLLVETDAPAMPLPEGRRTHALPPRGDGSTVNHPGNLVAAYAGLAEIRGWMPAELRERVAENFVRLFGPL
jgi:TatD DNase family protein